MEALLLWVYNSEELQLSDADISADLQEWNIVPL
jgi:hypothetical protein